MSDARHDLAPLLPADAALREAFERTGLRVTRQRAAVFRYLRSVDAHPTAEDVFTAVRRDIRDISLATVYKALDALVAAQLVNKITHGDGPSRYDCRSDVHYHFHCLNTHEIFDLPTAYDPDLVAKLDPHLIDDLKRRGFQVTGYRLELVGYSRAK